MEEQDSAAPDSGITHIFCHSPECFCCIDRIKRDSVGQILLTDTRFHACIILSIAILAVCVKQMDFRGEILRQATARAAAMTEPMPNADFFRGRVEAALAEIVGPDA